jgi:two-component system chemotaxis response regulator CheY
MSSSAGVLGQAEVAIIDDMPAVRAILSEMLLELGIRDPLEWEDGESAWSGLQEMAIPPRLILLDVVLPGMSGLDLVRAIRGVTRFNGVKILMVTSEGRLDHAEEAARAGANGYLVKPFDLLSLQASLGQVMGSLK